MSSARANEADPAELGDDRLGEGAGEWAPLERGKGRADVLLEFAQRRPEGLQVLLRDRGEDLQEDESTESFGETLGNGWELDERLDLFRPVPTGKSGRLHEQD